MKFKLKDKEVTVNPATLRQIHDLESTIGNIAEIGDKAPFDVVIKITKAALEATPQEVTIDWVLDNCGMGDLPVLNEMSACFLGASSVAQTPTT